MDRKLCMVLVGAPCSGKSTIGKATAEEFGNATYISSGEIARKMASKDANVQMNLHSGMLAPERQMRDAIKREISRAINIDNKDVVILDGFPRFGAQAEWLEDFLTKFFHIKYVLIDTPEDILRNRAKNRSRDDDNNFEKRLIYYKETTLPELISRINYRIYTGYSSNDTYVQILTRMCKEVLREERWR